MKTILLLLTTTSLWAATYTCEATTGKKTFKATASALDSAAVKAMAVCKDSSTTLQGCFPLPCVKTTMNQGK